jgi:hypothetical protein
MATAPPCSATHARRVSKASCRSGGAHPTVRGARPTGSRVKTRRRERSGTGHRRAQPWTGTKCHVWTAPGWQGKSSRRSAGRSSHVRPVSAVRMTAGHNAAGHRCMSHVCRGPASETLHKASHAGHVASAAEGQECAFAYQPILQRDRPVVVFARMADEKA